MALFAYLHDNIKNQIQTVRERFLIQSCQHFPIKDHINF